MHIIKKNIPNFISILRLIFAIPFMIAIYETLNLNIANKYIILLFSIIILSDIFDGYIARKMNCVTNIGANLDIFIDLFYILGSICIFAYFDILPKWFPIILIVKFIEFLLTSKIISKHQNSKTNIHFDKFGKVAAMMLMLLPGIFAFRYIIPNYILILHICVIFITLIFCISFIYRITFLINSIKSTH